MMKRMLAILMLIVSLFGVSACSNEQQSDNGVSNIKNTALESSETTTISNSENAYDIFNGTWAEENIGWEFGGLILDIYVENEEMTIVCSRTQCAPISRVAKFTSTFNLTDIKDSVVEVDYDNDGWGNSGKLEITFNQKFILCDFKEVVTNSISTWGIYEKTYKLIKNENAHELMVYTQEEYDAKYGETTSNELEENDIQSYDTSKASGILFNLGLTEEEFKNSCVPLNIHAISSKTTAYYIDYKELLRYPNQYVGQQFVVCNNLHDYFACPACDGTGKNNCTGGSWHSGNIFKYNENGEHLMYQSDLTTLVPEEYSLYNYGLSSDGYPMYALRSDEPNCYIFDMRDDIYSPNIASDAIVTPYLIFLGLTSDGTDLRFGMITCDVRFN